MPKVLKRNAVIVLGLAALFYWAFMFAKHDPTLRAVIPFGEDPYDAVGSFGVIIGMLIALLSFLRAFRPYHEVPSAAQRLYLVRSQEAVVLAIFITLAADAVAMARHPLMWSGAPSRDKLIGLLGFLAIITTAVQFLVRAAQQKLGRLGTARWFAPASVTLLAITILAGYPEHLINHTAAHIFTVLAGAVVLCAPMRLLLNAFVPGALNDDRTGRPATRGKSLTAVQRWATALLAGAMIGAFAFWGEMRESGNTPPLYRLVFVASVYIALGLAGIVIAYAFLGRPLGLGSRS